MHDFEALAATYIATWNETDTGARRAALTRAWAPDARYTDPLAAAAGLDQIDQLIGGVHASFPSFEFRLAGTVDGHHDQCRFSWELGPAGTPAPVAGFDVVEIDPDGRIVSVLGFLDRVPSTPAPVS